MGATNVFNARFGKTEEAHLAFTYKIATQSRLIITDCAETEVRSLSGQPTNKEVISLLEHSDSRDTTLLISSVGSR